MGALPKPIVKNRVGFVRLVFILALSLTPFWPQVAR